MKYKEAVERSRKIMRRWHDSDPPRPPMLDGTVWRVQKHREKHFDELLAALKMMQDLRENGLIDFRQYELTCDADINHRLSSVIAKCEEVDGI